MPRVFLWCIPQSPSLPLVKASHVTCFVYIYLYFFSGSHIYIQIHGFSWTHTTCVCVSVYVRLDTHNICVCETGHTQHLCVCVCETGLSITEQIPRKLAEEREEFILANRKSVAWSLVPCCRGEAEHRGGKCVSKQMLTSWQPESRGGNNRKRVRTEMHPPVSYS